jgi:hypothetical protein
VLGGGGGGGGGGGRGWGGPRDGLLRAGANPRGMQGYAVGR